MTMMRVRMTLTTTTGMTKTLPRRSEMLRQRRVRVLLLLHDRQGPHRNEDGVGAAQVLSMAVIFFAVLPRILRMRQHKGGPRQPALACTPQPAFGTYCPTTWLSTHAAPPARALHRERVD